MTTQKNSGLSDMIKFFSDEVPARVERAERELDGLVRGYADTVRESTPSGPSHRREFVEGDLRRSVSFDEMRPAEGVTDWAVRVGGGRIDYLKYVAARDGVEFFDGSDEVQAQGEEIVRRIWE